MLTILPGQLDGLTILALSGELTIFTAAQARQEILAHQTAHPDLQLDLAGVTELDTAGVQLLAWLKREAVRRGAALVFRHHSAPVMEVLDLLKVTQAFGDPMLLPPAGV